MKTHSFSGRRLAAAAAVALTAALAVGVGAGAASAAEPASNAKPTAKPTVVLVHGAFADSSGWNNVIDELQRDGYPVQAVANPLRSLSSDSAYLRSVLESIPGDVVLVGHSYGGAVITNAATGNEHVKALVYIAAIAPDAGDAVIDFLDPVKYPGGVADPAKDLVSRPIAGGDTESLINTTRFRDIFAADLPKKDAARMAVTQRPAASLSMTEKSGEPAWKTIPSWYQVSTQDKAVSPVAQRYFAENIGAETSEVKGSHVAFISHAKETAKTIEKAAKATTK